MGSGVSATKGPALVDALLVLAEQVAPDAEVVDGYALNPGNAVQWIFAVADPNENVGPAISSEQVATEGFTRDRTEIITVRCRFSTWPGDTIKAPRDRLYADLDILDAALRANHQLKASPSGLPLVESVALGSQFDFYASDGPAGDEVRLDFTITATALL